MRTRHVTLEMNKYVLNEYMHMRHAVHSACQNGSQGLWLRLVDIGIGSRRAKNVMGVEYFAFKYEAQRPKTAH